MANLFGELKRRNVFRVGAAYLIAAWLVLQVLDLALDNIGAPAWIMQLTMILIALGFPIILGFAWAFELTPEGVKRETDVDRSKSITAQTGRRLDRLIIVVLVVAVGVLVTDRFLLRTSGEREPAESVATVGPTSAPSRRSIAVLPFVNRSNAADDAFFVDGIHDDILMQLAKISSLKVISRTSVMQYRDTQKSMRQIGDELGVATIMEGSVQRAGDRVRINLQLFDANTDEHLWADSYDRALTASNIFDIQTEMAKAIAAELRASLTSDEERRLAQKPTESLEAYEAYLIGRQLVAVRSVQSIEDAKTWFLRAINRDPEFALAYVGVSDAILLQVSYGGWSPAVAAREAKSYIDKALELDPGLGEAYVSLGLMASVARDYDRSEEAYSRGIELAPQYAQGHLWFGILQLLTRGKPEEALELFQQAAVVDPLYVINLGYLSKALQATGKFKEARATVGRMQEIDPTHFHTFWAIATDYRMVQGRLDLAWDLYLKWLALDPHEPRLILEIASLYMDLNDDQAANCWLDRATALSKDVSVSFYQRAILSALQGDRAAAAEYARHSLDNILDPSSAIFLPAIVNIVKVNYLGDGRAAQALDLYRLFYPNLFDETTIEINRTNFAAAVDLADMLLDMNQQERANLLLSDVEAYLRNVPRLGEFGYWVTDARIAMLRGDVESALGLLQQAVDEGWRFRWRYYLEVNNVLELLRSSPRFGAIYQQIASDMAAQLERVRAKETLETSCIPGSA